ncbi:MAG: hypothetical protein KC609_01245 [Myxococcales bacterium]|nr:hypothetical protein [Myxococcales bacterium]
MQRNWTAEGGVRIARALLCTALLVLLAAIATGCGSTSNASSDVQVQRDANDDSGDGNGGSDVGDDGSGSDQSITPDGLEGDTSVDVQPNDDASDVDESDVEADLALDGADDEGDLALPDLDAPDSLDAGGDATPADSDGDATTSDSLIDDSVTPGDPCKPGSACNRELTPEGGCLGLCIKQTTKVVCRGTVVAGLCYGLYPPQDTNESQSLNGLDVTVLAAPSGVYLPGDEATITLRLKNTSGAELKRTLIFKDPADWQVVSRDFQPGQLLTIPNGGTFDLEAKVKAVEPNIFNGAYNIFSFTFDDGNGGKQPYFEVFGVIGYPQETDSIVCGGHYFPPTYCPGNNCPSQGYFQATCCDGVFYPDGQCCNNGDCNSGVCSDGYCVNRVPQFYSANRLPYGYVKILVVLVDFDPIKPDADICTNRTDLDGMLEPQTVEGWYDDLIKNRTGRDEKLLHWQWTVIAGLSSKDLIQDAMYDFPSYQKSTEAYLKGKGCLTSFEEYDRVVIMSSQIQINYGGQAFPDGRIAMRYNSPLLMVHELGHTFGANDTYLNIGDRFQWQGDLMGNYLNTNPIPKDGVAWTEVGLGDVDLDGVIDIFTRNMAPDSLVVSAASATVTTKGTIELALSVRSKEGEHLGRVIVDQVQIDLVDFAKSNTTYRDDEIMTVFDGSGIDLDALKLAGTLKIRVRTEIYSTDASFERKLLTLDELIDVPVQ